MRRPTDENETPEQAAQADRDWKTAEEMIADARKRDELWEAADRLAALEDPKLMFDQIVGLIIFKAGRGWGIVFEDGRETAWGWLPIVRARVYDVSRLDELRRRVGPGADHRELKRARVIQVRKTTQVTPLGDVTSD